MVTLGNERLFTDEFAELTRGRRLGLITNHSGVDRLLVATADRLHAHPGCELAALFGPEHGVRGDVADGASVDSTRDPHTNVPVHSLYGATQKPTAEMLAGIDAMVFDIQDVGVRFYTYLYTMSLSMEACAAAGIPFVVLDRPNPVGGEVVAGNVLEPEFASFVGLYPIPIQYGLTIGELASLFNEQFGLGAELRVVPMTGWQRSMLWRDTGLPWVAPSPNMPTEDTALVYPGTCFFEGTNLSEGRGTTKPFEQFGAPFVDGRLLAQELQALELPGVLVRPVHFQPSFSKHEGQVCQGVQLHVVEPRAYDAVRTGFEALATVRRLWPDDFAWRVPREGVYNFDRLAGSAHVREAVDSGTEVAVLLQAWQQQRRSFETMRADYLLY